MTAADQRPWGRRTVSALLLGVIAVVSAVAAWQVGVPDDPPGIALKSASVFRAEIFVGCFFFLYILLAVIIHTVSRGRPPKSLGFGLISLESDEVEKTVEALSQGAEAVTALERRILQLERKVGMEDSESEELREHLEGFRTTVADLRRMVEGD